MRVAVVKAARDDDAGVWHVEHSDVEGLHAERAGKPIVVPVKIKSRHTANGILKDARLPKAF